MYSYHGLVTSRDCCSVEAAAHEAVVNYREWAATKKIKGDRNKRGQSPFLYFDYSGAEKSERWKKGDCPLLFSPEG